MKIVDTKFGSSKVNWLQDGAKSKFVLYGGTACKSK